MPATATIHSALTLPLLLSLPLFHLTAASNGSAEANDETRLVRDILKRYASNGAGDVLTRPVSSPSDVIDIRVSFNLRHIALLEHRTNAVTVQMSLKLDWLDPVLTWHPMDYGAVKHVRIPIAKVWSPDIVQLDSLEETTERRSGDDRALAVLYSTGAISWLTPVQKRTTECRRDNSTSTPDTYRCTLSFASLTYNGFELDLKLPDDSLSADGLRQNVDYKLVDSKSIKETKLYTCCPETFPQVNFVLWIQDVSSGNKTESLRYLLVFSLPAILLTALMLMIFCVPADMDSKINLGLFIFIGYMILLFAITFLPQLQNFRPEDIIGLRYDHLYWFTLLMLCLVTVNIMVSVFAMNVAKKGESGLVLPECLRKTFNHCLGCLVCVFYNRQRFLKKYSVSDWDKNEQIVANRDWMVFSAVLDRVFFFCCLVVVAAAAVCISLFM